jgi:hypothetical protein
MMCRKTQGPGNSELVLGCVPHLLFSQRHDCEQEHKGSGARVGPWPVALNMIEIVGIGPFVVSSLVIRDMGGPRALLAWVAGAALAALDPRYRAAVGMNDPGESEQDGGLVYTRYGKGTYIYTGIAFFRQLPAGLPGAYRLFVNLLSASRAH